MRDSRQCGSNPNARQSESLPISRHFVRKLSTDEMRFTRT
jgi:hypothetical protein